MAAVVVLLVASGAVAAAVAGSSPAIGRQPSFVAGTPEAGVPVGLDVTVYFPVVTPAPAVLLAHGFGGSKTGLDLEAQSLAEHGYVVLAYTARGFGRSGGLIHLNSPTYEVADASKLITYASTLAQVLKDAPDDPRIGVAGSSYGGALALLLSAYDKRVDVVGADITWNDLSQALFPNAAGGQPGVFKKLWAGQLFASAAGPQGGACGRFAADLCAAYQRAARTGEPDAAILSLLAASSPAGVLDRITAPTLLSQGEQDSLFTLGQADANARGIAANGTPVKVADMMARPRCPISCSSRRPGSTRCCSDAGRQTPLSTSRCRVPQSHRRPVGPCHRSCGSIAATGPVEPSRWVSAARPRPSTPRPAGAPPRSRPSPVWAACSAPLPDSPDPVA